LTLVLLIWTTHHTVQKCHNIALLRLVIFKLIVYNKFSAFSFLSRFSHIGAFLRFYPPIYIGRALKIATRHATQCLAGVHPCGNRYGEVRRS